MVKLMNALFFSGSIILKNPPFSMVLIRIANSASEIAGNAVKNNLKFTKIADMGIEIAGNLW